MSKYRPRPVTYLDRFKEEHRASSNGQYGTVIPKANLDSEQKDSFSMDDHIDLFRAIVLEVCGKESFLSQQILNDLDNWECKNLDVIVSFKTMQAEKLTPKQEQKLSDIISRESILLQNEVEYSSKKGVSTAFPGPGK